MVLDPVSIAPAVLVLDDVASFGQVSNDAERCALSYAERRGDVASSTRRPLISMNASPSRSSRTGSPRSRSLRSLSLTVGAPAKSSSPRRRTRTLPASRTSMISSKGCSSLNSHARSVRAYAVERGGDPRNLSRSQRAEAASEGAPHPAVLLQPRNTSPTRIKTISPGRDGPCRRW
jgi:hypothetical protein